MILVELLLAAGAVAADQRAAFKMTWASRFLDLAWKYQFRIINYPAALRDANQIIGSSSFDLKKIGVAQFQEFVPALTKANRIHTGDDDDDDDSEGGDAMAMVSWEDGTSFWCIRFLDAH